MFIRLIMAVIVTFSATSFAKENSWKRTGEFITEKQFKKQLKVIEKKRAKNKKNKRKIANTDRVDYASVFADDAKNLSSSLIGGNTWKGGKVVGEIDGVKDDSAKLATIVNQYDNDTVFNKLSPQAKWMAAQLASLKPLRGIVTRIQPLVSKSKAPFVHAFIVTWVRSISAGVSAFNPNSEWEAGFDYLVKPYVGMQSKITTEADLYRFVRDEVLPSLEKLNSRVRAIAYNGSELDDSFSPFYFDNKLLYSTMNVVDERDRFVVIDRGEIHGALANINLSISSIRYGLAYDWSGLLRTINKIAVSYGFKNILVANPDKMTAEKRISIIKKNKGLFKLIGSKAELPEGGANWTKAAYPFFREGVRQGRLAWTYTRNYQSNGSQQRPLLDPRGFLPFERLIDNSFDSVADLIEGDGVRSSIIRGEEVQVNFQKLFNEPPSDMKDFLAVKFVQGKKTLIEKTTKMKYRNYKLGNPDVWNLNAYKKYFPEIEQQGVPNAARILSQTWGGNILGAAFLPVLF